MVSVFSLPFFRDHHHLSQYHNALVLFMVSPKNNYVAELLFSLLNFLGEYQENGILPYTAWVTYDPLYSKTALLTSQLLLILLEPNIYFNEIQNNVKNLIELQEVANYYIDLQPQDSVKIRESQDNYNLYLEQCSQILSNHCFTLLSQIQDQSYLRKIAKNCFKLLKGNSLDAKDTYLLYSMKKIDFSEEIFMLLWRINQNNKYFVNNLIEGQTGLDFLSSLLVTLHEKFMFSFQSGGFNLSLIFLSQLSLIREFQTSLITPLKQSFVIADLPVVTGNYFDFFIAVIHNGINNCFEKKNFCPSVNFMAILSNLSSYIQNISVVTSFKLIQLLQLFSNYENIFDDENNILCIEKLLAIIDNIIVFQGEV